MFCDISPGIAHGFWRRPFKHDMSGQGPIVPRRDDDLVPVADVACGSYQSSSPTDRFSVLYNNAQILYVPVHVHYLRLL